MRLLISHKILYLCSDFVFVYYDVSMITFRLYQLGMKITSVSQQLKRT